MSTAQQRFSYLGLFIALLCLACVAVFIGAAMP